MTRGYGQYCPVALASEILGERWTILIVMALMDGVSRFNGLQRALPRISATMLSQRLRTLERSGVIARQPASSGQGHEYTLSDAGKDMESIIMNMAYWGQRWARDMELDDLDPRHLAWSIHLRMNTAAMPPGRTVLEFVFTGGPEDCRRFWIINTDGVIDMCIEHPGYEIDLRVKADLRRFVETWRGFHSMHAELSAGRIKLEGPGKLKRSFPKWLLLSSVAHVARERPGRERAACKRNKSQA